MAPSCAGGTSASEQSQRLVVACLCAATLTLQRGGKRSVNGGNTILLGQDGVENHLHVLTVSGDQSMTKSWLEVTGAKQAANDQWRGKTQVLA